MPGVFNGYWVSKNDPSVQVYVEKTFKKGYVTGFKYQKIGDGTVHSQFKATYEELENDFKRK